MCLFIVNLSRNQQPLYLYWTENWNQTIRYTVTHTQETGPSTAQSPNPAHKDPAPENGHSHSGTGWDLGTFVAVLASGQTCLNNKIQRNCKGWKITACVCSWGKFRTKDANRPENPTTTFEETQAKAGHHACPLHPAPPKGRANHLSLSSSPTWTYPYPYPGWYQQYETRTRTQAFWFQSQEWIHLCEAEWAVPNDRW